MSKVNFSKEMLANHTDDEVIEYLYDQIARVRRAFNENLANPYELLKVYGSVENAFSIIKAIKDDNES